MATVALVVRLLAKAGKEDEVRDFLAAAEPLANYPAPEVVKADFLKLLDRPRVAPEVRMIETGKEEGGLITEHFQFVSEKKPDGSLERVPVLLIRTDRPGKKLPAVIVLHGTGGNKEAMRPWLVDLARRGIIGVAIDARYHAERVGVQRGSDILKAVAMGAKCVALGRLQAWGLGANGKEGCQRMLEILENEIISAMGLLGVTNIDQLNPKYVCKTDPVMPAHEMSAWTNMPGYRIQ